MKSRLGIGGRRERLSRLARRLVRRGALAAERTRNSSRMLLSALESARSCGSVGTGVVSIADSTPTGQQHVSRNGSRLQTMRIRDESTCRSGVKSFGS